MFSVKAISLLFSVINNYVNLKCFSDIANHLNFG